MVEEMPSAGELAAPGTAALAAVTVLGLRQSLPTEEGLCPVAPPLIS